MLYIIRLLYDYITRNDEVFVYNKYCKICYTKTSMKINKNYANYNSDNRFQEFQCTKCNKFKTTFSLFPEIESTSL